MGTLGNQPWWDVPENFDTPLVFCIEAELESLVFGRVDTYLRSIEVHSQTLVQLEKWFTVAGHTRVTVVGPRRAREWLLDMMRFLWSKDSQLEDRGMQMLLQVRRRPLTEGDHLRRQLLYKWDPSLAASLSASGIEEQSLSEAFESLRFPHED